MNTAAVIAGMERFPVGLAALIGRRSGDDVRWRPASGAWSILEIVNHLADEEVEDFRRRLELTLADPTQAWPGIDPEAAARQREYNAHDFDESLERFAAERERSIQWLRSLDTPDWEAAHQHPSLNAIRAGDLLTAWSAHDALHLRQIAKRLFELAQRDAGAYSTEYAGAWGP